MRKTSFRKIYEIIILGWNIKMQYKKYKYICVGLVMIICLLLGYVVGIRKNNNNEESESLSVRVNRNDYAKIRKDISERFANLISNVT